MTFEETIQNAIKTCEPFEVRDVIEQLQEQNTKLKAVIKEKNEVIDSQKAEIDDLHSDTIPKLQAALVRANKYGLQADEANNIFKEEIKRLQGLANYHRNLINELNKGIAETKAEAVKEFAERLKDLKHECGCNYRKKPVFAVTEDKIDNLVKEMVGETK